MSASPLPIPESDFLASLKIRSLSSPDASAAEALAQTGEYSILGLTRTEDQSVIRERQLGFTLVLFGVATIIALLYSIERYFYSRLVGDPVSLTRLVPAELIFTYAWALLTPLVMYAAKRYPGLGPPARNDTGCSSSARCSRSSSPTTRSSRSRWPRSTRPSAFAGLPKLFGQSLLAWTVLDALVFCVIVVIHHAVVYYRVSKDRAHPRVAARGAPRADAAPDAAHAAPAALPVQHAALHLGADAQGRPPRRLDGRRAQRPAAHVAAEHRRAGSAAPVGARLPAALRRDHVAPLRRPAAASRSTSIRRRATRACRISSSSPSSRIRFVTDLATSAQGAIAISVRRDGDMLRCDVVDDGRGLRAGHKEGVGLASTRQRLAHLYGERHAFSLRGAPGEGVHVTMAIPFHPYDRAAAD